MSPWPSSDSAPFWSRITRESVWEETAKAIRAGTLALIRPVMMSALGRWVASRRWMPTARDFCARRMIASSTSPGAIIIRSASSSITHRMYGSGRSPCAQAVAVQLDQAARARRAHDRVALLHLLDQVRQHVGRQARARDHRREQVRDRLVVVQLHLLRVDQHHPDLVGRGLQQDRRQHRVHGHRLARARGAGHQHVRLLGQVGADRLAGDVLAEPDRERRPALGRVLEDVAQVHHAPVAIRNLDAHGLLAGDRREDPDLALGRQRIGQVVLELGDLGHLDPGRQAQLVARHVRAA